MRKKIRTVIVDDEARLRRGIERLVLSCDDGCEIVGSYSSGMECLEAFQQTDLAFDLLITDVKMPGIDGLTLIKELKKVTTFHAMVISGFDDFQFLQTAIREGASDYMIKPIDRDEFRDQLKKIREKIMTKWDEFQHLEEIELKASQLTYVKQIQKLSQITWQQDIDLSELEWTKEFPNGDYLLLYVSMDNLVTRAKSFNKEDWDAWTFAIENISDEMMNKLKQSSIQSWKWKGEDLSFWLLLHVRDDKSKLEERGIQFAEDLRKNIKQFTPLTCSIAVSQKIGELTLLSSIKDELLTFIKFRLLYGGNQIFSNSIIEKLKENKGDRDNKEVENKINKIIFSLDSMNQEKTKREITSFLNTIETLESPLEIEKSVHLLGIQIINYMIKNTQGKAEFPLIQEVFSLTKKMANLIELKNEVFEWIKKVLHILDRKTENQSLDHIEIAKKWIVNQLDQNITIHKIASQVYMNPTYFCEFFKNQTGETVLDYVTRIRIEKARELLVKTDLKIYDISIKVGYTDTKYFSKLFKKHYGEVPSKYKERMKFEQI
ncbi:response regulator transcription factor [Metabacillus bambusae]|uniref:Response regulator n=1 Tax=Metabacillus bambusae TaxID=2795218 RepID=A0ABS3MXC8_9BACI|nr:helix-turn-helix domain-containing protein [Metabacillus bambusae]MBO1510677.1 response regulator [Metabacillus bambusae]